MKLESEFGGGAHYKIPRDLIVIASGDFYAGKPLVEWARRLGEYIEREERVRQLLADSAE